MHINLCSSCQTFKPKLTLNLKNIFQEIHFLLFFKDKGEKLCVPLLFQTYSATELTVLIIFSS